MSIIYELNIQMGISRRVNQKKVKHPAVVQNYGWAHPQGDICGERVTHMTQKIIFGDIVAEAFALKGAKAAVKIAAARGRSDLVEKIHWGRFRAPSGPFNARRAPARAEALKLLAA